jgi:Superinfection immunity protein
MRSGLESTKSKRVWTIDYYYSERGLDGVFVLKHLACYFRGGKIIGYSDPVAVEEEHTGQKNERGDSSPADGARNNLSHNPDAEVKPAAGSASSATALAGAGFLLLLGGIAFYFLPTILAGSRHHHNGGAIFIINLLLGWTLVGWAVALAWAFTSPTPAAPATVYIQKPDGTLAAVQAPAQAPKKVKPQIFRL